MNVAYYMITQDMTHDEKQEVDEVLNGNKRSNDSARAASIAIAAGGKVIGKGR